MLNSPISKSTAILLIVVFVGLVQADPCGMVPPIYTGHQSPIARIGLQKTYVFFKDGVETFVIRPGFSGNVDNFGMLIPFPSPPELRKVPDNTFDQIANAIDPPEVVVDLRVRRMLIAGQGAAGMVDSEVRESALSFRQKVRVVKQEAVGMYEVAVLEAGSAAALKRWMDQNGYQYPEGMDQVTNEYVQQGWCFVAVKTKVGQKSGVDPRPGQRDVVSGLPKGSLFDGNVQGMGFRFRTDQLVVPMRLSAFNEGEMRNVVYLLTDGPRKIRSIPEEHVMRQISGRQLFDNLTKPLPVRIIGGDERNVMAFKIEDLEERRKPEPKNGVAKELFASDLMAVSSGNLSLEHEEQEKELLRVGEYLGLRGVEIDNENLASLKIERDETSNQGLEMIKNMTLTVIDGDFPREVVANENLTFAEFEMPKDLNNNMHYDANRFGPGIEKPGVLRLGKLEFNQRPLQESSNFSRVVKSAGIWIGLFAIAWVGLVRSANLFRVRLLLIAILLGALTGVCVAEGPPVGLKDEEDAVLEKLSSSETATAAIDEIKKQAKSDDAKREKLIKKLIKVVRNDDKMPKRGWAIAALVEIGGQDVDEYLLDIHADQSQPKLVRTWAAAGRVSMTRSVNGLIEKAQLISKFPALGRPIGMRLVEKMGDSESEVDAEKVIGVTQKVPQLQAALAPSIMSFGADELTEIMINSSDNGIRRLAAGYLGTLAQQGDLESVVKNVIGELTFDGQSESVPWSGGALFVPSVQWNKEDARQLVGSLIRWYLWCDIRGKSAEQRQIHNNIRSLGLANAAGYKSPGWNNVDCVTWLVAWGNAVGRAEIKRLLEEQDVDGNSQRYAAALDRIRE